MTVFRDLIISWKGKDYTVTPDMRLMRSIEMQDVSFTDISVRTSQGRPPLSHIAYVLWRLLQAGGALVTEEEVYEHIGAVGDAQAIRFIELALTAFVPTDSNSKNPAAQTGSPSQARAAQETENSIGS